MLTAKLISCGEHSRTIVRCAYGAADAAKDLGVSESTVRRTVKALGVKKISGRTIAGFVRFQSHPVDVSMSYSE